MIGSIHKQEIGIFVSGAWFPFADWDMKTKGANVNMAFTPRYPSPEETIEAMPAHMIESLRAQGVIP